MRELSLGLDSGNRTGQRWGIQFRGGNSPPVPLQPSGPSRTIQKTCSEYTQDTFYNNYKSVPSHKIDGFSSALLGSSSRMPTPRGAQANAMPSRMACTAYIRGRKA